MPGDLEVLSCRGDVVAHFYCSKLFLDVQY